MSGPSSDEDDITALVAEAENGFDEAELDSKDGPLATPAGEGARPADGEGGGGGDGGASTPAGELIRGADGVGGMGDSSDDGGHASTPSRSFSFISSAKRIGRSIRSISSRRSPSKVAHSPLTGIKAAISGSKRTSRFTLGNALGGGTSVSAVATNRSVAAKWKKAATTSRGGIWIAKGTVAQRFVRAARDGNLSVLAALLRAGVDINVTLDKCADDDPCQQTALIKAVRHGHFAAAYLLLANGADIDRTDAKERDAWYYCLFSPKMPPGGHRVMARILLLSAPLLTARVLHLAAHAPQTTRAAPLIYDLMGRKLVSSDETAKTVSCVFNDIHLLDVTSDEAQITWPDGTSTAPNTSALDTLVEKECMELLTHPAVLALLRWKLNKFGTRFLVIEAAVYAVLLCAASMSVRITANAQGHTYNITSYESDWDVTRLAFEIITVICCVTLAAVDMRDYWRKPPGYRKHSFVKHVMGLITYAAPIAVGIVRFTPLSHVLQIDSMAVCVVLVWLRLVHYAAFVPTLGNLFILIQIMLTTDVVWFLVIQAIVTPGFALAFTVMFNNRPSLFEADVDGDYSDGAISAAYSLLSLYSGAISWKAGRTSISAALLFLAFVFLNVVLSLNLLIAMLTRTANTYTTVGQEVTKQWVKRMALFVTTRQHHAGESAHVHAEIDGRRLQMHGRYTDFFVEPHKPEGQLARAVEIVRSIEKQAGVATETGLQGGPGMSPTPSALDVRDTGGAAAAANGGDVPVSRNASWQMRTRRGSIVGAHVVSSTMSDAEEDVIAFVRAVEDALAALAAAGDPAAGKIRSDSEGGGEASSPLPENTNDSGRGDGSSSPATVASGAGAASSAKRANGGRDGGSCGAIGDAGFAQAAAWDDMSVEDLEAIVASRNDPASTRTAVSRTGSGGAAAEDRMHTLETMLVKTMKMVAELSDKVKKT